MSTLPQPVADELQDLHDQMMRLTVRVGFLLSRAGVDLTGISKPKPASIPAATPARVVDLTAYRAARGA